MVESFTNVQRRMWYILAHCGICRYYIDINSSGRYYIKKLNRLGLALTYLLYANVIFKFVYHVLTYHGYLGITVHFMDQMGMWDWFLMYAHVFFECYVWFFKYPMWENLYRQWELQEDVYRKLGRPEHAAQKIMATDKMNFVIYGGICIIGTLAFGVQFFQAPKYALNTYAIVPADNLLLTTIFCIHECLFLGPGYGLQAFTMVLAESYAVSYQHLLEEMNKALRDLIRSGKKVALMEKAVAKQKKITPQQATTKEDGKTSTEKEQTKRKLAVLNTVDPKRKARGTEYDIGTLINDYRKLTICSQFHNQWIGAIMGVPEGISYAQFVCDVFMMIQLLKEAGDTGELDFLSVAFYIMDACFGMIMLFRMLIILSRMYPQAEEFVDGLKYYASLNTPLRKEITKVIPTLRICCAKLTGKTVKPETVPTGVNVLINWYINAALWQRPEDRKT